MKLSAELSAPTILDMEISEKTPDYAVVNGKDNLFCKLNF